MPWDQLSIYIYNLGCQVMPVRGDGFCFLNAIGMVLSCDYNEVIIFDSMEGTILVHLAANVKYYKWFHTGDILNDKERYLKFRTY